MTDFCICRAIVSLLSPTSYLRAFLTSLEYPPSTFTIISNCITRYSGYLCSGSQRNGPYFVVFSASFSSLFSTQEQLISITDTFLFPLSIMVASLLFGFTCVLSAYGGMSQLTNWRQFSCVCPVIDHEFRHNIVKEAVDPRGDSRVDPQTTLTMLWRNSLSITGQTHEKLTSICFLQ